MTTSVSIGSKFTDAVFQKLQYYWLSQNSIKLRLETLWIQCVSPREIP